MSLFNAVSESILISRLKKYWFSNRPRPQQIEMILNFDFLNFVLLSLQILLMKMMSVVTARGRHTELLCRVFIRSCCFKQTNTKYSILRLQHYELHCLFATLENRPLLFCLVGLVCGESIGSIKPYESNCSQTAAFECSGLYML